MKKETDWEDICPGSTKSRLSVEDKFPDGVPESDPLVEYRIGRARALKMFERFGWKPWMANWGVGPDGGQLRIRRITRIQREENGDEN